MRQPLGTADADATPTTGQATTRSGYSDSGTTDAGMTVLHSLGRLRLTRRRRYRRVRPTPFRPGDNLSQIAAGYGVAVGQLLQANGIQNPNIIYVGQQLVIP